MNNELVELLRSVLKEELNPINNRLDNMDQRFVSIENRLDSIEIEVQALRLGKKNFKKQLFKALENLLKKSHSK